MNNVASNKSRDRLPSIPSEWRAGSGFCASLFEWAEIGLVGIDIETTTARLLKGVKLNEFRLVLKQCLGIQADRVFGFLPDHRAIGKGGSFSIFHQHLDVMLQLVKAFLLMLNLLLHFDELIKHQIGIFILREIFNAQRYMRWIELQDGFGCGFTGID